MKKIFFMAVSAVLLAAGCQKTEIQNEVLPKIGFDTHMGKLTKAPDAGNENRYANLNEQGFKVWGYFVNEGDLNYKPGDLYLEGIVTAARDTDNNIMVESDGSATSWETGEETYYWPGKNKPLDIYCVSLFEKADVNTYAKVSQDFTNKKLTVENFVVDEDADNDLMVAPLITQHQDEDEFVKPAFTHALTKVLVNFTTGSDQSEIYVISATTTKIANEGTLVVDNRADKDSFVDKLTWTLTPESTQNPYPTYTDQYTEKSSVDPETITGLPEIYETDLKAVLLEKGTTVKFASWLLLPQEDLKDISLDVEYIVDKMYIKQRFELATGAVTSWNKNMQTTYTVNISPDYIEFLPSVEEWINDDYTDQDRGEFLEYSVKAKYSDGSGTEVETELYYNGELKEGTAVYVKSSVEGEYDPATDGNYTIQKDEKSTMTLTVEQGKITNISESDVNVEE